MSDDYFLRNRSTIAIITGGTQGLGLAIAKRLAHEGAPGIVISGRNAEKGEEAAASVRTLVYRLLNPLSFAAGQLAVFQGASEVPISVSYGSSKQRGKTANWPRPGGLR
jgi:NAD(P)-dependent dehydrogenase (short-subunit alcohol dehydrogenase family)